VLLRLGGYRHAAYDACTSSIIDMNQDQLAQACNLSRSAVSLILHQLRQEELVESQYGRIKLLEPDRLLAKVCACDWR